MSELEIVCFRVTRPRRMSEIGPRPSNSVKAFSMKDTFDEFLLRDVYRRGVPIDWSSSDPTFLTANLNNLSWLNKWDLQSFERSCKDSDEVSRVVFQNYSIQTKNLPLTLEQKNESCDKFISRIKDFSEILSRDEDALNYVDIKGDLYAVVLIYQGEYQGHIYTWISPFDASYCFAMGIRNRLDSIFTVYSGNNLRNVSSYLFEGVRRFALSKGASHLIVPYPRPIMTQLLPKLGFVQTEIKQSLLRLSLAPQSIFVTVCDLCFEYQNLMIPSVTNPMTFRLID